LLLSIERVRKIGNLTENDIDDATLQYIINEAENTIEALTQFKFINVSAGETLPSATEFFNGGVDKIFTKHRPIQSVTSLKIDGTAQTEDIDFYVYKSEGMIKFASTVDEGEKIIEVTYTYGFTDSDHEFEIANTAATYLAISLTLMHLTGGEKKALMYYNLFEKTIQHLKDETLTVI